MQDYGLAIRSEDLDRTLHLLRLLYIVFALMKRTKYMRALGLHFLLLEYHQGHFQHSQTFNRYKTSKHGNAASKLWQFQWWRHWACKSRAFWIDEICSRSFRCEVVFFVPNDCCSLKWWIAIIACLESCGSKIGNFLKTSGIIVPSRASWTTKNVLFTIKNQRMFDWYSEISLIMLYM